MSIILAFSETFEPDSEHKGVVVEKIILLRKSSKSSGQDL